MKTILITGAGSGICRDVAVALAKRGHAVIATTHYDEQGEKLKGYANENGCELEIFTLDITKKADREKIQDRHIDVLINGAAIGESGPLSEIPMDRVRSNFETNVFATLELTQLALHNMIERKKGTVLIISSVLGRIPNPFLSTYSMTKFALTGGVAAMREEVHRIAPNVHVSLIEPGAYATGFNQLMQLKKYEWMDGGQYTAIIQDLMKEDPQLKRLEMKTNDSIVTKIVKAVEADKPKLRYSAPWWQALVVQVMRIFGV